MLDNFNPSVIQYENYYIQCNYPEEPILQTKLKQEIYINKESNMMLVKFSPTEHKEINLHELDYVGVEIEGLTTKHSIPYKSIVLGKMLLGNLGVVLGSLDTEERIGFDNAFIEIKTKNEKIRLNLFWGIGKNYTDDSDVMRRLEEADSAAIIINNYII